MPHSRDHITLRFLAQPGDINFGGNVHGGSAMKWLDQAGYVCATTWSNEYCVTAFVGDISFQQPISVGSLIEVNARIIHTGTSSMHISIDLYASNPSSSTASTKAIHCIMVFVAVDENGKPVKVPGWNPLTEKERTLQAYALRVMEVRKLNREALTGISIDPA